MNLGVALEVKVYREIREYRARVLFGLSWRQLLISCLCLPTVFGAYFLCLMAGQEDLGVVLVVFLAVPFVVFGWWYPMNLKPEEYVGYWFVFFTGGKVFTFDQEKVLSGQGVVDGKGKSRKVKRQKVGIFETQN